MLHNPQVLFLDEPTTAMDPHSARVVRDAIADLRDERRVIVLCTHNLTEAEVLADRIAVVQSGRILAEGTAAQLTRKLLGEPIWELQVTAPLNGALERICDLITVEHLAGDRVRYRTSDALHLNPVLLDRLHTVGVGVVALSEVPRSLETVYLHIVGDMEADLRWSGLCHAWYSLGGSCLNPVPVTAVARRELAETTTDWRLLIPLMVLTFVVPLLIFVAVLVLVQTIGDAPPMASSVPLALLLCGFLPAGFSLVNASESFVGEKERNTLEALLSTPMTDHELYFGKLLATLLPPLGSAILAMVTFARLLALRAPHNGNGAFDPSCLQRHRGQRRVQSARAGQWGTGYLDPCDNCAGRQFAGLVSAGADGDRCRA